MAEFADLLHRDNARGSYSDVLLMHSPRMEGSQIFMGHAMIPSSLCKGMDEPSQAGLSPDVDYKDVFGGPPRFAALMSEPHLDRMPTATLDKMTARQLSLRTSSLPVFDLPVFGDNAFSSTVYEARAKSDNYDDMFDEEGPMPGTFAAFNLRSKASSLSSSRRMSPVHPAAALASQPGGDETFVATSSTPILKARPAAGKFSKRGSLSSASSFDEGSGKLGDGSFTSLGNDGFTSSLPSSPPQSGSFGPLRSIIGSSVGASTTTSEVDDVFGGFPKRIFPRLSSAVPHDSRTVTNAPETHGTRALEKAAAKGINKESRVCSSSSAAHASETSDTRKCTFSRSSSVNNGRDQHEKELMMDRQTDSSVLEKSQAFVGKGSNIDDDMHLSFQSSFKLPTRRASPVPVTELKFKSWKDLASDVPASHSSTTSSIIDWVPDASPPSIVTPTKDVVKDKDAAESLAKKQFDENLSAQQNTEKPSQTSAAGHKGKVKSAQYTIDLEERELQALLANAWKINKQMERENYNAKFPEEAPKVSEVNDPEHHWEEQRKHAAGKPQSSRIQQCDNVDLDKRDDDINWKEWRKYGRRQKKELSIDVGLDESLSSKDFNLKKQVSAPDTTRSLAETGISFGAAKSRDREEPLKAATEEALMDRVLPSFEVSPDALAGLDSQKKFCKGVSGDCASSEYLVKEQALDDFERAASFHGFMSGPSQDFVYNEEQNRLTLCVPVEDAECLIDLASSLHGFQEVEGETWERRKSRWERHMRARERAAKALEEMQHRDAELQRQQDEKHQFSETSDGKIKRWAAGKEGNLRALLSNLQHVLWSECGWQPIPLRDLIEVPDVKKAYRKATLFVHPDKVQQKGASIQQKYIAERVFDILQEAWKTFNMQESF